MPFRRCFLAVEYQDLGISSFKTHDSACNLIFSVDTGTLRLSDSYSDSYRAKSNVDNPPDVDHSAVAKTQRGNALIAGCRSTYMC